MRRRFVTLGFGTRVYGQSACAPFGNRTGAFQSPAFVFVTEPHFCGERNMCGQTSAQRFDDVEYQFRLF
ncbi:Uncharacterised protein [Neisseria meningitidis]|nr:Uncharacterised protein [Neisseria meningitidis]